jgi:hypothetical protein
MRRNARRKFHELWANHASKVGQRALRYFQVLFRIEEGLAAATSQERRHVRQRKSRRVAAALHKWLLAQRQLVPDGSATARAIDYSLKRWKALTRYIDDGDVPISTGLRTRSGRLHLAGRTGCSPAAYARGSGPQRS